MSLAYPPTPPRGEDLPYDDGEPADSGRHRENMTVLADSLEAHYRDRPDAYVAANMALYFSAAQAIQNDFKAPDVMVILDTHKAERKSWVVWEEDGRTPDVVIELTSPLTEEADRGPKLRTCEGVLGVGSYVVYDPFSLQLDGFQRVRGKYVPVALDADGRLFVSSLGLSLGVVPGAGSRGCPLLRWFDGAGHMLKLDGEGETDQTAAAARQEAAARAAQWAEKRADTARSDAVLAERTNIAIAAAARAKAEALRADAWAARANAESARANAEAAARAEAEAEITRLRALLGWDAAPRIARPS